MLLSPYTATGTTPAMCMRLTSIGSLYIYTMRDRQRAFFDGARSYRVTVPADIPDSRFWSVRPAHRLDRPADVADRSRVMSRAMRASRCP
jgi:hypothetical protein